MDWDKVIRTNIRYIIKDKGFVQKAVACRAGYSKQTFNNMLTGRRMHYNTELAVAAAHSLRIRTLARIP